MVWRFSNCGSQCTKGFRKANSSTKSTRKEQNHTTYDKDGNETGKRCVPVSTSGCSFSNQNTVEDKISESELHSPYGHRHLYQLIMNMVDISVSWKCCVWLHHTDIFRS